MLGRLRKGIVVCKRHKAALAEASFEPQKMASKILGLADEKFRDTTALSRSQLYCLKSLASPNPQRCFVHEKPQKPILHKLRALPR